jgi:hypothetical protein
MVVNFERDGLVVTLNAFEILDYFPKCNPFLMDVY